MTDEFFILLRENDKMLENNVSDSEMILLKKNHNRMSEILGIEKTFQSLSDYYANP